MNLFRRKPLEKPGEASGRALAPTLGAFQLMLMGVGGTIGTGIFVLTSGAAQTAGPAMVLSFLLAGIVCGLAALCYAELAAMIPRAGSAYTYTYMSTGELPAWLVGWALVLEYAITAAAVAVGWSGYLVGELRDWLGLSIPAALVGGPFAGGIVNLPAIIVSLGAAALLMLGTRESVRVNAVLVVVKLAALALFAILSLAALKGSHFTPFAPEGWFHSGGGGILGAAATVFFTFVGFDAVATAAEETKRPQRNVPLGLIGGLVILVIVYMAVAIGVVGSPLGGQPLLSAAGAWLSPGSTELAQRCAAFSPTSWPLPCSRDGLAYVMRFMGYPVVANLIGLAATFALPSVVLVMIYGQTRMFMAMARDGLLPQNLAKVHPRFQTPQRITAVTGIAVAVASGFLPVGKLADIANAGTLFAFFMVAIAILVMRRRVPGMSRPFRVPAVWLVAGLAMLGCLGLFASLPGEAELVLPGWSLIGLVIYFGYSVRHSKRAASDGERPVAVRDATASA